MNVQQLARYESKYAVPVDQLDAIHRSLAPHCVLDEHCVGQPDQSYTIDSLYLDTRGYEFFEDGENRRPIRLKLRIRSYPNVADSVVKIEVKRRVYDMIVKTSTVVARDGCWDWLTGRRSPAMLPDDARRSLEEFLGILHSRAAEPRMLIRYRRQAFHGAYEDYVRVTFDRSICYQPMRQLSFGARPERWTAIDDAGSTGGSNCVLMELKYRTRPPVWMSDLVLRHGLRRQGYSKYNSAVRWAMGDFQSYWDYVAVPAAPAPIREGVHPMINVLRSRLSRANDIPVRPRTRFYADPMEDRSWAS